MKRPFLNLFYVVLIFSIAINVDALEINRLASCNDPGTPNSVYTVLSSQKNILGGWSHIDSSIEEYSALNLQTEEYEISQSNYQEVEGCDRAKIQQAILVVKLSDWTRQHSNGLEALVDNKLNFADMSHVLIDMKINRAKTRIPSREYIKQRYGGLLNESELMDLDTAQVNLGVTLFSERVTDESTDSFNAEYFLSIDQVALGDEWLRILIPLSEFTTFTEKDYIRSGVLWEGYAKQGVYGLRINSETSNGKQLRNILGDQWHRSIPEIFKEISISLRRIEFLKIETNN